MNTLEEQLNQFANELRSACRTESDRVLAEKLIAEAKSAITPPYIDGTIQKFDCDPREVDNGLALCMRHFINCGAAKMFGEKWSESHA